MADQRLSCASQFLAYQCNQSFCTIPHTKFHTQPNFSGPINRALLYKGTNHTPSFSAICRAVPEIRKRGAHVRRCTCTPPLTFVKRQANGSLATNQISAQSVQPLPRYGKGGASARAQVCTVSFTPPMTCVNMHRVLVSKHTPSLVTIGLSIPEL